MRGILTRFHPLAGLLIPCVVFLLMAGCSGLPASTSTPAHASVPPSSTPESASPQPEATTPVFPSADSSTLPEASWSSLPQWHGFNLGRLFSHDWSDGRFTEEDFRLMAKQGFNYARLPLDYRYWINNNDWNSINEDGLKTVDDAVRWGIQYNIHIDINLHRAPGYCVNPPLERLSLWDSAEAQQACAVHWAMLARRYRGIPNKNLSFNLLNEPPDIDPAVYVRVVKLLVEAIRREDPDRLILADGLNYGTTPVPELKELKIAQSMHNYQPMHLTHYKASWVQGSDAFAVPTWPVISLSSYLYGSAKPEFRSPLVIEGEIASDSSLILHVNQVSDHAALKVLCDGKVVYTNTIRCTNDPKSCKTVIYAEQWKIYQNIFDQDYTAKIPAGTKRIEVSMDDGDWLTLTRVSLESADGKSHAALDLNGQQWGQKAPTLGLQNGKLVPVSDFEQMDRAWLRQLAEPWLKLKQSGVGVMVGECGVFNQTPHEVALKYLADTMSVYHECGFGWALWEYSGSFGILNSDRTDVKYADIEGKRLDEEMYGIVK